MIVASCSPLCPKRTSLTAIKAVRNWYCLSVQWATIPRNEMWFGLVQLSNEMWMWDLADAKFVATIALSSSNVSETHRRRVLRVDNNVVGCKGITATRNCLNSILRLIGTHGGHGEPKTRWLYERRWCWDACWPKFVESPQRLLKIPSCDGYYDESSNDPRYA